MFAKVNDSSVPRRQRQTYGRKDEVIYRRTSLLHSQLWINLADMSWVGGN